jgi:hypothetical protein
MTLILVNDDDIFACPAEIAGALDEVVLPGGAGGVFAHLEER